MNLKILTSVFSLERKEVGLLDRGTSGNLNSTMITIVFFLRFTKPEKRVSLDHQYQKRTLSHLEPRQLSSMYTVILKLFKWILIMEKILQWNKYCQVIYYIMILSLTWLEYCSLFGGRIQLSEVYCMHDSLTNIYFDWKAVPVLTYTSMTLKSFWRAFERNQSGYFELFLAT